MGLFDEPVAERPAVSAAALERLLTEASPDCLLVEGKAERWLPLLGPGCAQVAYVDPPFATGKERRGQEGAFSDLVRDPQEFARSLAPMLELLWRALGAEGTLLVHLDWHASHHVKVLCDELFGWERFRNEIVWCYNGGGVPARDFPRKHDVILRYARGETPRFHVERRPYKENTQAVGRHSTYAQNVEIDLERGTPLTDWWTDIPTVTGWSPERTGYPTQKPLMLLRRLIATCSDPGDLVLDPCVGSGTTSLAAHALGRRSVGGDLSATAISLALRRLEAAGAQPVWSRWPESASELGL